MDPNEALATIRRLLGKAGLTDPKLDRDDLRELVTAIDALDYEACRGHLPAGWLNALTGR